MSVPSWKRNESTTQFIDTARELYIHTLKYAKKFPKSAMFVITKDIIECSKDVFKDVICANKIFAKTKEDLAQRRYLFNDAIGNLATMDAMIPIAKELYSSEISDYGWLHWGELLYKEQNLIKGVMMSDEHKSL